MAKRYASQKEHDTVIMAAAAAYEHWKMAGFKVSVNPDGQQNHNVGGGNFPDVVVWKPDGDFGRTIIIEEVETAETVTDKEANEWARYARFGAHFYLIVPKDRVEAAKDIVKRKKIEVDHFEAYWFEGDQVKFSLAG